MKILAICLAALGLTTALLLKGRTLNVASGSLTVTNFRGRKIPAVGGLVLMQCVLVCAGALALVKLSSAAPAPGVGAAVASETAVHLGLLLLAAGFFSLGLVDDLSDGARAKGIRGHFRALLEGEVTGGLIKAAGGLTLAFFVAAFWERRAGPALLGAVIIAASANLLNLLDLRPGRACKFYLLVWIPLAVIGSARAPSYLPLSAGLAGAAAGWLHVDLSERGLLGDSGSNLLGAVAGAGIVLATGPLTQLLVLLILMALTLASERFSFSRAIDRFPPFRWFDNLGRTAE